MSLSNYFTNIMAGPSTRTLKRTHAEITRTESRSPTPEPPSKRRRTSRSTSLLAFFDSPPPRVTHRQSSMSDRNNTISQNTIDLTVDDDSPSPLPYRRVRSTISPYRPSVSATNESHFSRAPPFGRNRDTQHLEVIDLSDDDEDEIPTRQQPRREHESQSVPSSPEVEFVRERPAQTASGSRRHEEHQRPTQSRVPTGAPERGTFLNIPDIIRRSTQFMFGSGNMAIQGRMPTIDDLIMDQIDGLNGRGTQRAGGNTAIFDLSDDYDGINFDYRQPAFALGGFDFTDRSSETPQGSQDAYKGPPPPKEGFIRSYGEEEILICPACGDELATGKADLKQQVFVVKQCGHVYCGDCVMTPGPSKTPNKKDTRRNAPKKAIPLKKCRVEGCEKIISGKAGIFPIYL